MNRILITLLLAMLAVTPMRSGHSVVTRGDTIEIVDGSDTVRVMGINELGKRITHLLNDTVMAMPSGDNEMASTAAELEAAENMSRQWSKASAFMVLIITIGVVMIVLFSMLFRYLHRRRKYRMVEKAIENNYPLPSYIFGGVHETVRTVYVNAPVTSTPPTFIPPIPGQPDAQSEQPMQPINMAQGEGRINWMALKGGFTLTAVGIGALLFFSIAGANALAGACAIIILLGLGKMWLAYQDQKSIVDSYHAMRNGVNE
ncbi:MAG: hypothetical protein IKR25_06260 [Muribaculaceae bacterium]|nr:hypothetical protein [Muribaculaceae bacterium]